MTKFWLEGPREGQFYRHRVAQHASTEGAFLTGKTALPGILDRNYFEYRVRNGLHASDGIWIGFTLGLIDSQQVDETDQIAVSSVLNTLVSAAKTADLQYPPQKFWQNESTLPFINKLYADGINQAVFDPSQVDLLTDPYPDGELILLNFRTPEITDYFNLDDRIASFIEFAISIKSA